MRDVSPFLSLYDNFIRDESPLEPRSAFLNKLNALRKEHENLVSRNGNKFFSVERMRVGNLNMSEVHNLQNGRILSVFVTMAFKKKLTWLFPQLYSHVPIIHLKSKQDSNFGIGPKKRTLSDQDEL